VSTSELCFTKGNLLHTLVAKALINQFKDGNYDVNKTRHNHERRRIQQDIIDLSKKYSIITEFTSFGASLPPAR
jgi:poly [ADP-ribose] polymerase